jgi:protein associated with RNAse G/E
VHADGTPYRWWHVVVLEASANRVVVVRPHGEPVYEPDRVRTSPRVWQQVYWTDRFYNVTESYDADGQPRRLDVDIAAPVMSTRGGLVYCDYELDVVRDALPGAPAVVYDEDEFAEASVKYRYNCELQAICRAALAEAVHLVETWRWLGLPSTFAAR